MKEKTRSYIALLTTLTLIIVSIILLPQLPVTDWSSKIPLNMTEKKHKGQITSNNTIGNISYSTRFAKLINIIDYILSKNKTLIINSSLIKPLIISMNYYYKAQKLYEVFGGHGLVPLRSLAPYETQYFNKYSLEVSEYACEIPYLYAWLYWITSNETYLQLVNYSVNAIRYWSIDSMPLGGCWGSTDPIVYSDRLGKYIIRWKLITWYMQSQASWFDEEWFKKSVYNSWRYITWYDPVYDWYWFSPWEILYHGTIEQQEYYKESFMGFVHAWINNTKPFIREPYAYILPLQSLVTTSKSYVEYSNNYIEVKYSPVVKPYITLIYNSSILLAGNNAYSIVMKLEKISGKVNITITLSSNGKIHKFIYPLLPDTDGIINITFGNIYVPEDKAVNYTLKIIISPQSPEYIDLRIHAIGIVSTPNMGLQGLIPTYYFWGDSIGPLALAYIHYYPGEKDEVLKYVKNALSEIRDWGTDRIFYPPDPRWSFYYWSSSKHRSEILSIPVRHDIHYASLEESLESFIPLYILTGDEELLQLIRDIGSWLSHDNYWRGLGYWSLWFGLWTHLWLYAVTGDRYFLEEAKYYIGVMDPFNEALDEEVSNAAKFIEANIVAYYILGDRTYLEYAENMTSILLDKFVDPDHGFIRSKADEYTIARHDMLAWTASPLLSLYLNIWVPDWMLWLYPIAIDENGRPNSYFTVINVTYTPSTIYVWDKDIDSIFMFKYNGYLICINGIRGLEQTSTDYFPYTAHLLLRDTDDIRVVGFNNTDGTYTLMKMSNEVIITSSLYRGWIIYIGNHNITKIMIDGREGILGRDYYVYKGFLLVFGSIIDFKYD